MGTDENTPKSRKYDVALSFAGEDREFVERAADVMRSKSIRVFYDRYEEAELWGKNLYTHLRDVYEKQASFTVVFISQHYAAKLWTNHERESAQSRAFEERKEYILPARFDDTPVPGLPSTVGYVDLREKTPEQLAVLVEQKLRTIPDRERRPKHRPIAWEETQGGGCASEIVLGISDTFGSSETGRADRVAFDPFAYQSLGALLDDLFMNYLRHQVSPYSYGSEWVLTDGNRVIAPLEWIGTGNKPIIEVYPDWFMTRPLQSEGLIAGTSWWVTSLREQQESNLKIYGHEGGFFGFVTNDEQVAMRIVLNGKALFYLHRHIPEHNPADSQLDQFKFKYIFRDVFDHCVNRILVYDENLIDESIRKTFLSLLERY
jgi:hypothetical protein